MALLDFLSVLIDIAIITSATQYTAAIIPFFLVALYFLQDYYLRTSRQMRHLDLEAKSPLYTLFMETGSGLQHIRAFKWQTTFQSRCIDLLNYSQKPYYLMFCIQRWLVLVLDSCVSCIAMVVVGLALGLRSTTVPSAIGLALINLVGFSQMLSDLIRCWTDLETSLGAISRLKAYATSTPLQAEPAQPVELPKNWPGQGRVELKSVRAKYKYAKLLSQNLPSRFSNPSQVLKIQRLGLF